MKIGVSLTTSFSRSEEPRAAAQKLVERARAVRTSGLNSLFVGDHHATPAHYFQNTPTLGRLLAETGEMTVGALFLMPLWHPVLLAEQVGTLAALAGGPLIFVAAAGDDENQFAPFGVSLKTRASRFEENLAIALRLLSGERVTFEGRYHKLKAVSISPVPGERPETWVGASATPALKRAASMGDAWLAAPGACGEELQTQVNIYKRAADGARKPPVLTIRRDVFVGATDADAEAAVAPVLARGYRGFRREALVIGGPERVAQEFAVLARQGFSQVLVRHIVPDQELLLASYERLGREVLPAVRDL